MKIWKTKREQSSKMVFTYDELSLCLWADTSLYKIHACHLLHWFSPFHLVSQSNHSERIRREDQTIWHYTAYHNYSLPFWNSHVPLFRLLTFNDNDSNFVSTVKWNTVTLDSMALWLYCFIMLKYSRRHFNYCWYVPSKLNLYKNSSTSSIFTLSTFEDIDDKTQL